MEATGLAYLGAGLGAGLAIIGGGGKRRRIPLIEIFAGYISSSVQNALDAIRAREVARRDHLTGLFNERYFNYRLREEIRRASISDEQEVALLFIDLDAFKPINDRMGHDVPPERMDMVSDAIISHLRRHP